MMGDSDNQKFFSQMYQSAQPEMILLWNKKCCKHLHIIFLDLQTMFLHLCHPSSNCITAMTTGSNMKFIELKKGGRGSSKSTGSQYNF